MATATTTTATPMLLYDVRDGVGTIMLNRPERNNAWAHEMKDRYFDLLDQAAEDPAVRALVLTGAGKSFCVGADMEDLQKIDPKAGIALAKNERPISYPLTTPKPIVAAINGACAGIGLVTALYCDVRIAAAGCKFTTAFVRRGLVAEHGISWILPRLIGQSRALDLLLSGRVILAEEALEMGLVNRVAPRESVLEIATAYARDLAQNCSPRAMSVIRGQIYQDYELPLGGALEKANRLMAESLRQGDVKEGVASFIEKRPPKFAPMP
jgi:enoyl-CoA hydratase/carnithine racemase